MKISYNWLGTLVNSGLTVRQAAEILTASGLEVEAIDSFESVKGGLQGLVVGQVLECSKHPDADRLSLTRVDIGNGEPLSIVCGAPNVAAGQKVIVATPGATLFPLTGEPFEIKKSKIRGAVSEGMICAEDEIGLGTSHAGIMVLPPDTKTGTPASEYFKIEKDEVLEIGLTPNRSDAASHLGVARDLVTVLNSASGDLKLQVNIPGQRYLPDATGQDEVEVIVENQKACPRYCGLVIRGLTVQESPAWLQNRLKAIALRPINNIVDVTNFVLHELGQPLHAFDLDKIKGKKVIVRNAKAEERFTTLDGTERTLQDTDLMICDASDPMCIAGVFGGQNSGVSASTTSIFLESAYFDPDSVRATSKRHALKTDASFRFERGTDPEMTLPALIRAANLIIEIAGGIVSMGPVDIYPEKLEPHKVAFSYSNCHELIGKDIERNSIRNILLNLGIEIESEGADGLLLKVPRYKTDVTREADLVEEVMRIYGYNKIEAGKEIRYTAPTETANLEVQLESRAGRVLEGFGFSEIMCLSLTKESYYAENDRTVAVLNPLSSDLGVLRADMVYGGLEAIAYNLNRKNNDLKFFEIGRTYFQQKAKDFKYGEQKHITLFVCGQLFRENPYGLNQSAEFSFLKAAAGKLFEKCGLKSFKSSENSDPLFASGLEYSWNKKSLALLGELDPVLLKKFDIAQPVYYACINWQTLLEAFSKHREDPESYRFNEIPKFPPVRRDLALLVDRSVKYGEIEELAFQTERKLLKEVNLFDIYQDEKLGAKKSYAVSFTLVNPESTLTDKQIDGVMEKLLKTFREKLGAELR